MIGKHLDHLITKLTIAKTKISFSTIPLNQCKNDVPDVFSFEVEHSSFVDVTKIVVVRDVWPGKHDFIKAIFNYFYIQISVIASFEPFPFAETFMVAGISTPEVLWK